MIRVAMIALSGVILAGVLKELKSGTWTLISLGVTFLVTFYVVIKLNTFIAELGKLKSLMNIDSNYIGLIIKAAGLTYITQFTSDICRDNGYGAVAGQIETLCHITIAVMCLPMLLTLFETISKCIG